MKFSVTVVFAFILLTLVKTSDGLSDGNEELLLNQNLSSNATPSVQVPFEASNVTSSPKNREVVTEKPTKYLGLFNTKWDSKFFYKIVLCYLHMLLWLLISVYIAIGMACFLVLVVFCLCIAVSICRHRKRRRERSKSRMSNSRDLQSQTTSAQKSNGTSTSKLPESTKAEPSITKGPTSTTKPSEKSEKKKKKAKKSKKHKKKDKKDKEKDKSSSTSSNKKESISPCVNLQSPAPPLGGPPIGKDYYKSKKSAKSPNLKVFGGNNNGQDKQPDQMKPSPVYQPPPPPPPPPSGIKSSDYEPIPQQEPLYVPPFQANPNVS